MRYKPYCAKVLQSEASGRRQKIWQRRRVPFDSSVYKGENKKVHDAENIAMRQAQGRRHRGAVLTAGSVKNKEVLWQMVQRDDAYKFLKQV